ncbi:cation transporter [Paenibacillus algicola]|uniref:cation transporter n=1 Tax=Paenibacillus algicola TaxID=2565926 RepID=UPI001E5BB360|nr:cation transporter [Paenibacillus algicola]
MLSVVVSASVLFGGWFLYRHYALQNPIAQVLSQYEGVNDSQIDIKRNTVTLKLDLQPETDLRDLVSQIQKEGKSVIDQRELMIEVADHSSDVLNEWWDSAMLSVAQAMDNRQYTDIQTALNQLADQRPNLKAVAQIDDQNVYVSLSDGTSGKFIILPRHPGTMEVWNHA